MATSMRQFKIELYEEHIEEAAFLYEQRRGLLVDDELSWLDLTEFERRLEAHLDALVIGGELALGVCRHDIEDRDPGEVHVACCVFSRQAAWQDMANALETIDLSDDDLLTAVSQALRAESPSTWEPRFIEWLAGSDSGRIRIAARVLGYRRVSVGRALVDAIGDDPVVNEDLLWALGRSLDPALVPSIRVCLGEHRSTRERLAAVRALLRLGDRGATAHCADLVADEPDALVAWSSASDSSEFDALTQYLTTMTPDAFLAVALHGDIRAVDALIDGLEEDELGSVCAVGLYAITGAELFEEVFIEDEVDTDSLFDDEIERLERGEPLLVDGQPPAGGNVVRLSQDPDAWREWWTRNRRHFDETLRYRCGAPCSASALLDVLNSPLTPHIIRRQSAEELAIRYGAEFPFEPDLEVSEQQDRLRRADDWARLQDDRVAAGSWCGPARSAKG